MGKEVQTPFICRTLVEGESSLAVEEYVGYGAPEVKYKAGDHGGLEHGVIGRTRAILHNRTISGDIKHSYQFVPWAHPDAIRIRRRKFHGHDINREYTIPGEMPEYPPAILLRRAIELSPIYVLWSFHEDKSYKEPRLPFHYYHDTRKAYSQESALLADSLHEELVEALRHQRFRIHTGYDTLLDPALGNWFDNGRVRKVASENYDTSHERHVVDLADRGKGTVQEAFTFEIPGYIPLLRKQRMLETIFDVLIIPFTNEVLSNKAKYWGIDK